MRFMRWMQTLRLRFRALVRRDRVEQELDDELRFHLERLTEQYDAAGMAPAEARYAALREMGGVDQRKEECRDARGLSLLDSMRQDAAYALRSLRGSPVFTAVAVSSLALGIGANTTMFTFVDAVLLRPLPYPASDRIVTLRERPLKSEETVPVHPFNFLEWRERARSFDALALAQYIPSNAMGPDGAEQVNVLQATSELFQVFGVAPSMGRAFTPEETGPGSHPIVILSHGFWERRFGSDPGVIGKSLVVSGRTLTVIGVAARGFRIGPMAPDLYRPLPVDPRQPDAIGARSFLCYGRLKPDVDLAVARSEMAVIADRLERQYPLDRGFGVSVFGLHSYLVKESRPVLGLLMGVVATVLLIACVNLAGLLLARGVSRRRELAIRASLGAGRGRLMRQLIVECLLLSLLGGALGVLLAEWTTRSLLTLSRGALTLGSTDEVHFDARVLVFTIAVSLLTVLLFGLLPAWQATRLNPQGTLSERGRGRTGDVRHARLRSGLVIGEVALATVLLVGAGLLLRTFSSLLAVPLGFQPAHVLTLRLFLGGREAPQRAALIDEILERVEALPDVRAAGTIQFLPLTGLVSTTGFRFEGQPETDPAQSANTDVSLISRGYFAAMGIPVVEGRPFVRDDRMGRPRVALVNQSFVRRFCGDGRPLGRRIVVDWSNMAPTEIVGVVGDVRNNGLTTEPQPTVFLPHAQTPGYITNVLVRTTGDPVAAVAAVRQAIREIDRTQAVGAVKTMEAYLDESLARPRLSTLLVAAFAGLAALLAGIGLYGLVTYTVSQRANEIGIRMALGAQRSSVFRMVLAQGTRLAVAGLILGLGAALALRRIVSGLLFGVSATDPQTYVAAAAVLGAVALAAAYLPARRATLVDPIVALRSE